MKRKISPQRSALVTVNLSKVPMEERETVAAMMRHLEAGADEFIKAAQCWIQLSPDLQQQIKDSGVPGLQDIWGRLEKIGRGELAPALLHMQGQAPRYLSRLPVDVQEYYLKHKIPVLKGKQVVNKHVTELSAGETAQVFRKTAKGTNEYVRSVREQEAWIESRRHREKSLTKLYKTGKWSIERGKAKVMPGINGELTAELVRELLRDLNRCSPA